MFDTLIVQPIFNMLLGLYSLIPGGDFGVSLILFTILVRLALWPLVKKQLHQVKAMRKLQPELAKLKKQAKGNRQMEGMMMLELYKKHGVSPFRSIGILLIQLPIFIALFRVIQIITNDRERVAEYAYSFMANLQPIKAIIDKPEAFNEHLFGIVDLTDKAIGTGVNWFLLILAIGAALLQYYMTKQTTPQTNSNKRLRDVMAATAEGKQPDQAEVNAIVMGKMMKFLPVMMFFIMVSLPGALALYYGVSNLVAVVQQHFILKQDVDEMEKIADKDTSSSASDRAKKAKKAKVVSKSKSSSPTGANVTRITAKDSGAKKTKGRS